MCACLCVLPANAEAEDYISEKNPKEKEFRRVKLCYLGNHQHKCQVLWQKSGELVVSHRPTEEVDHTTFVPCKYCYANFSKLSLWKHTCPLLPDCGNEWKGKRVHQGGASLLTSSDHGELTFVLVGMRKDNVGDITGKDALIVEYGRSLVKRYGNNTPVRLLIQLKNAPYSMMRTTRMTCPIKH